MSNRVYLDNAATSWPKPITVYEAVDAYQRGLGAAAGRSGYREALAAERIVEQTRMALHRHLGVPQGGQIIFHFNGTDALNLCLLGCLQPGDHAITTTAEHNSVLRPLAYLRQQGVQVTYLDCDAAGRIHPHQLRTALQPHTRLVAVTHASNVTGGLQDIGALGKVVRQQGGLLLVDAAQTVGHLRLNLRELPVDLLAAPGHKGLLGPLGTGFTYVGPRAVDQLAPIRFGGTGHLSDQELPPANGPADFEVGNLNLPGLAGLAAGIAYVDQHAADIAAHDQQISQIAWEQLSACPRVRLLGPPPPATRVGLISLTIEGLDCHEVASICDVSAGIMVRAGLHCAPRIHHTLGCSGSIRASWGPFTTTDDIRRFCAVVRQLTH